MGIRPVRPGKPSTVFRVVIYESFGSDSVRQRPTARDVEINQQWVIVQD